LRIVSSVRLHASVFALLAAAGAASPAPEPLRPASASAARAPAGVDSPGALTLAAARRLALGASPGLAPPARRVESARALTLDAGRRSNPTLEGGVENIGGRLGSRFAETTIQISQPIELGGKPGLRAGTAEAGLGEARAELDASRLEVVEGTDEAFLDAWLAQERLQRLRRAEQIAAEAVAAPAE